MTPFNNRARPYAVAGVCLPVIILCAATMVSAQRRRSRGTTRPPATRPAPTATPRADPNKIPVAEAERRIQAHLAFIGERSAAMSASFYYDAPKTLKDLFNQNGVGWAMQYADSWARMGIGGNGWGCAKQFYNYHHEALTKSSSIIYTQGYAAKDDLDYLDSGMEKWKQYEQNFRKLFLEYAGHYVRRALLYDHEEETLKRFSEAMSHRDAEIDKLKAARRKRVDEYRAQEAQIGEEQAQVHKRIVDAAGTKLFSPIDERLVTTKIN
ncbi:MAG: hypothetical protein ACT4OT_14215 [Acidobacteriota bacterium]